ncbi:NF038122 family metalloprotease [Sphingomonas sp. XXL09]
MPAQAVTFVLNDTGGAGEGTQARIGFNIATLYWSSVLRDSAVINLDIGFRALAPNVLGSTGSNYTLLSMNQGYAALAADATSALDQSAVANLAPLGASALGDGFGAVSVTTNALNARGTGYVDTATRTDNDGSVNNSALAVTSASAKALGITTDVNGDAVNYAATDGSITFSNEYNFDFDPTNGIAANAIDFIGVAIHEIGHALGFVSGVDSYDAFTAPGSATTTPGALENYVVASQLDLFRYGKPGTLDWSTQGTPYFSIDGGQTQLFGDSRFSTGVANGDGRQASHWKDSAFGVPQLGILDPTSGFGQMQEVTALDLAAYDAIGYDVGFNVLANSNYRFTTADAYRSFIAAAAVPEPAVWLQMILGFGVIGGAMRYRRRRTAVRFAAA